MVKVGLMIWGSEAPCPHGRHHPEGVEDMALEKTMTLPFAPYPGLTLSYGLRQEKGKENGIIITLEIVVPEDATWDILGGFLDVNVEKDVCEFAFWHEEGFRIVDVSTSGRDGPAPHVLDHLRRKSRKRQGPHRRR